MERSRIDDAKEAVMRGSLAFGGIAALLSAAGSLVDVGVGMATGSDLSALPPDAAGRFSDLLARPALGLYHLDLLNLLTLLLMLPALYAAWLVLKRRSGAAGLALVFAALGSAVFAANNPALPLLGLAGEWARADASRRALLAAAGEAILARGAHGSPGVLLGFLLPTLANILLAAEMFRTRLFPRVVGILGLAGNSLLAAYLLLVTFQPRVREAALAFAAPGGLLAIAWTILTALALLKAARAPGQAD